MIILLVDDDAEIGSTFGELLRRRGHTVTAVTSGREALARAASTTLDVIILDVRMPDMDGSRSSRPSAPAVTRRA